MGRPQTRSKAFLLFFFARFLPLLELQWAKLRFYFFASLLLHHHNHTRTNTHGKTHDCVWEEGRTSYIFDVTFFSLVSIKPLCIDERFGDGIEAR